MQHKAFFGALIGLAALVAMPSAAFAQYYGSDYSWGYDPYSTSGLYDYYSPMAMYGYDYYPYQQYSYSPYSYGSGSFGYGDYNPYTYSSYNWYYPYLSQNCGYQFYGYNQNCQNQQAGAPSITNVSGPNALVVGQQGTWSVTTSAAAGNLSVSVRWGDESQLGNAVAASQMVSSNNTFTHAYQQAGTYTITFTVVDGYGRSNSATATVVVTAQQQESLAATPTSGQAPLAVAFSASNLNANSPYSYYLDFGDGHTGALTSGHASHTYAAAGTYAAKLMRSSCPAGAQCFVGPQAVAQVTITVTAAPAPGGNGLSANPASGNWPLQTTLSATGLSANASYFVDFGDGAATQWLSMSGTTGSVSHVYYITGTFTATLVKLTCNGGPYGSGCANPQQSVAGTAQVTVH